jgi:hypothetical protein
MIAQEFAWSKYSLLRTVCDTEPLRPRSGLQQSFLSSATLLALAVLLSPAVDPIESTVFEAQHLSRSSGDAERTPGRNRTLLDHQTVVTKLNRMMNGWANYFCLGPVSKAYRVVDMHTARRLRQ